MDDRYVSIPVTFSRAKLDELHAARKAAGLHQISDSGMAHLVAAQGVPAELETLKLLNPEAA